ncbi:MAG TPA: hypothetical protein PLN21_16005 [Gemmatales bacterium]|nr:hypothetical protein [Gemmatales bacterium]
MQLEELQQQWQRLDQKLDLSLAMQNELVKQVVMQPAQQRINRLAIWPAIDVAFSLGVLLLCGSFLGNNWQDTRLMIPAEVVMIGALALLISSVVQLNRIVSLDWTSPVAEIQKSLEQLRAIRIQQFSWVILLSPLVGFCALIVGLYWVLNWLSEGRVHILDKLDPWWVIGNYVFGLVFLPLGYYLARVLARRCQHQSWWQAVLDGISGMSLKRATIEVERWSSLGSRG